MSRAADVISEQVLQLCYCCLFLRYLKDGSLLLLLSSWFILSLTSFIKYLLLLYLKRARSDDETASAATPVIRSILIKSLRYFQCCLLFQTAYSLVYHSTLDIKKSICTHKYGFFFMQLINEYDCGKQGKWMLFLLDTVLLVSQLMLLTVSLTPQDNKKTVVIPQLNISHYGILSICQVPLWAAEQGSSLLDLVITTTTKTTTPRSSSITCERSFAEDYGSISSNQPNAGTV